MSSKRWVLCCHVSQGIEEEEEFRENLIESKTKEVHIMENKIRTILEAEFNSRREAEQRLLSQIEEKTNIIKNELKKESQLRQESIETLQQYLDVDIPKIYETLRAESEEREQMESAIMKQFNEDYVNITIYISFITVKD